MNINLQKLQLLIPWDLGDYDIQTSKFFFWGVLFIMNFFTPKLMKIRWSSLLWGSFALHFQIKLNIHTSNLNSRFVSMNELELFLLTGVLAPNFNTMDLVKFLEKNKKNFTFKLYLSHWRWCHAKPWTKKKVKKVKNQDYMGKTNYSLAPCPSTTWLHVRAPQ